MWVAGFLSGWIQVGGWVFPYCCLFGVHEWCASIHIHGVLMISYLHDCCVHQGLGLDVLVELLRAVPMTHLIQLQTLSEHKNLPTDDFWYSTVCVYVCGVVSKVFMPS